jgi:MFS family permease
MYELYALVALIMTGMIFSMTSIETIFSRNLPKESRGTMNGLQSFFGALGGLWLTKMGGYLHDFYGPKSPFLVVAITHFVFSFLVGIAGLIGKFK